VPIETTSWTGLAVVIPRTSRVRPRRAPPLRRAAL